MGPALAPYAQRLNLALDTVHEPTLLGTGGGLKNALPKLGSEKIDKVSLRNQYRAEYAAEVVA